MADGLPGDSSARQLHPRAGPVVHVLSDETAPGSQRIPLCAGKVQTFHRLCAAADEPADAGIDARRANQSPETPPAQNDRCRRGKAKRGNASLGALLSGPFFPILLHVTALRYGDRKLRITVVAELVMTALWSTLVLGALHQGLITGGSRAASAFVSPKCVVQDSSTASVKA